MKETAAVNVDREAVALYKNDTDFEEYIRKHLSAELAERIMTILDEWNGLVRCKDCIYGYLYMDVQNGVTDSWIECRNPDGLNRDVSEDNFCGCGERKDGEGND